MLLKLKRRDILGLCCFERFSRDDNSNVNAQIESNGHDPVGLAAVERVEPSLGMPQLSRRLA